MVVLLVGSKRFGLFQLPLVRCNIRKVCIPCDACLDARDVKAVYEGQGQVINLAATDHEYFLVISSQVEGRCQVGCRHNTFHGPIGLPGQDNRGAAGELPTSRTNRSS